MESSGIPSGDWKPYAESQNILQERAMSTENTMVYDSKIAIVIGGSRGLGAALCLAWPNEASTRF